MSNRQPTSKTETLIQGVLAGDRALLGRAITLVESQRSDHQAQAEELLAALLPQAGQALRVGVTGAPGVGKSTFIETLGGQLTAAGRRVAVLAVDPSSAVSRGSILGDKTRMEGLARDPAAFIRPSATGGSLGGVARKTRESILVCEAAGFDVVLVETVGVGQSETLVAGMVDFFLLLMLAGAGDELQGIKRGIMELADAVAITKADGDNAAAATRARSDYAAALRLLVPPSEPWQPRVLTCSALENQGITELWQLVEEHHRQAKESGRFEEKRREQAVAWFWALVEEGLRSRLLESPTIKAQIHSLEEAVAAGQSSPSSASSQVLRLLKTP